MRSVMGALGAAYFAWQGFTFMAIGTYTAEDGASSYMAGDPAALAVTSAVRSLSLGIAILSLALVEWSELRR